MTTSLAWQRRGKPGQARLYTGSTSGTKDGHNSGKGAGVARTLFLLLLLLYQFEPLIRTTFPTLFFQRIHRVIEKIVTTGA